MRTLITKDIAPFTKILSKMELREVIKAMFKPKEKDENGNDINNNGQMISELIWGIVENYYKVEQDFFAFMADLNDKTVEEISTLSIDEFINLIKELFSEKNMSFFKSINNNREDLKTDVQK